MEWSFSDGLNNLKWLRRLFYENLPRAICHKNGVSHNTKLKKTHQKLQTDSPLKIFKNKSLRLEFHRLTVVSKISCFMKASRY